MKNSMKCKPGRKKMDTLSTCTTNERSTLLDVSIVPLKHNHPKTIPTTKSLML